MSLFRQGDGDICIIAKEEGSDQAQYPCDDCGEVYSLNKDNSGGDQVKDRCYEGSEEITPGPVDESYPGMQVTSVEDKEENSKDHLNH